MDLLLKHLHDLESSIALADPNVEDNASDEGDSGLLNSDVPSRGNSHLEHPRFDEEQSRLRARARLRFPAGRVHHAAAVQRDSAVDRVRRSRGTGLAGVS